MLLTTEAKCHLVTREGWKKTIIHREPTDYLEVPFTQGPTYVAQLAEDSLSPVSPSIVSRTFRLVKKAQIVDYERNERREERWYKEQ